jgi:hypothetical protein
MYMGDAFTGPSVILALLESQDNLNGVLGTQRTALASVLLARHIGFPGRRPLELPQTTLSLLFRS